MTDAELEEIAQAILDVLYKDAGGHKTLWDDWEEKPKAIWREAAQSAVNTYMKQRLRP